MSEHIQRYVVPGDLLPIETAPDNWTGRCVVLESDHVAAVGLADRWGFERAHNEWAKALPQHLATERALLLDKARGAVAEQMYRWGIAPTDPSAADILAALDALRDPPA